MRPEEGLLGDPEVASLHAPDPEGLSCRVIPADFKEVLERDKGNGKRVKRGLLVGGKGGEGDEGEGRHGLAEPITNVGAERCDGETPYGAGGEEPVEEGLRGRGRGCQTWVDHPGQG